MLKLLKSAGIYIGLFSLIFLSIVIGFQKIPAPAPDNQLNPDEVKILRDGAGTSTAQITPQTSPKEMVNKKISPPVPPPQKLPVNNTPKVSSPEVAASPQPKSSVSTPGPLITTDPNITATSSPVPTTNSTSVTHDQSGALNSKDITMLTNAERSKEGLGALTFNTRLAAMAEAKAIDMINKQYFAHVSPDGTDVTKLAANVHYAYLNLGENLALGDFRSSDDVVTGWMNSPGHRANILNKNFTEIGVSAIVGKFEGRMVWYSVQEFGRPMPDCPKPNTVLEQKIALYETQVATTETTLVHLRAEIDAPDIDHETYDTKVKDYNTLVAFYNGLLATLKADITVYNAGVQAYNTCIGT
jgi:uncharacterized protein YkwD